jgi:hydrogenase nickel incorporation protein HypA/HybF
MTSLIDRVCEIAAREQAEHVTVITVKRGELCGVIPEALEFCFDVCTADTAAEKAVLKIETVLSTWKCHDCGSLVERVADLDMPICSACGSYHLELASGGEFRLESIEVS